MRVAQFAVDDDILTNNGGTPILRVPRDAAFWYPCLGSLIFLPLILSIRMSFHSHRYDFLPYNCEIVGKCIQTTVATFGCARYLWKSTLVGQEKPAAGNNANS